MFESCFACVEDDALVGVIEQLAREEAQTAARRLAAIAELVHRTVEEDDERGGWAFDPWDNTTARVAAALNVGQRRASGQMRIAVALRDRLPRVAGLFFAGAISARLISELTWRTQLVDNHTLIAVVDAELAEKAAGWGPLSEVQLVRAIDAVIERHDPGAVRRSKEVLRTRDFHIGAHEDPNELTVVWGRLSPLDAAAMRARITAMVAGVCEADPRSMAERWADAVGAMGHGNDFLACRCGASGCPAAATPKSNVVVRVIADQAAVDAALEWIAAENAEHAKNAKNAEHAQQRTNAEQSATPNTEQSPSPNSAQRPSPTPDAEERPSPSPPADERPSPSAEQRRAPDPEQRPSPPVVPKDRGVALLPGRGVVPTAVLAEALRGGAKVAPLWIPGAQPEPGYRPSARLAEFVRVRDLFCRFPGCDVPADRCDLDHVIPWPVGPTHPSNLNCKCRAHHLMKTFWGGPGGWRDVQLPDATVIWTAPDGRTYTTKPGSRLFFPSCDVTTADLPPPTSDPPTATARSAMMPRRRRPRAAEEASRIKAERARNNPPGSELTEIEPGALIIGAQR